MDINEYFSVSEEIFQSWLGGEHHPTLCDVFDLTYVPEPYLIFGSTEKPCIFLTTNPGGGLPQQLHPGAAAESIVEVPSYQHTATALGAFYRKHLKGPARSNIEKMLQLASALGFSGVVQVEMIPWHSSNLPNKGRVMERLQMNAEYTRYHRALGEFLERQPMVLSWAAGSNLESRTGEGVRFKTEKLKIDPNECELVVLARKKEISQCLLLDRPNGNIRGLFITKGSANLPANVTAPDGRLKHELVVDAVRAMERASGAKLQSDTKLLA